MASHISLFLTQEQWEETVRTPVMAPLQILFRTEGGREKERERESCTSLKLPCSKYMDYYFRIEHVSCSLII